LRRYVPVKTVDIENLGDPHQSGDVVKTIVYEQEEPEIDFNSCFSMTRYFASS
jgi:hypothetical protein